MIYPIMDQRFEADTVRRVNDPARKARWQMRSRATSLRKRPDRSVRSLVGAVVAVVTAIAMGAITRFLSLSSSSA